MGFWIYGHVKTEKKENFTLGTPLFTGRITPKILNTRGTCKPFIYGTNPHQTSTDFGKSKKSNWAHKQNRSGRTVDQ